MTSGVGVGASVGAATVGGTGEAVGVGGSVGGAESVGVGVRVGGMVGKIGLGVTTTGVGGHGGRADGQVARRQRYRANPSKQQPTETKHVLFPPA